MSKQAETIAHNMTAINRMRERQAQAVVTGGECPKCGGGANPTILERFGHCIRCQSASFGR